MLCQDCTNHVRLKQSLRKDSNNRLPSNYALFKKQLSIWRAQYTKHQHCSVVKIYRLLPGIISNTFLNILCACSQTTSYFFHKLMSINFNLQASSTISCLLAYNSVPISVASLRKLFFSHSLCHFLEWKEQLANGIFHYTARVREQYVFSF
jgi:hypothetical protein